MPEFEENYKKVLELYKNSAQKARIIYSSKPERIEDVATEMQRIKNDGLKKDIEMKEKTLIILFLFLSIETLLMFIFSFLQATKIFNFFLDEWSFRLLIIATISQITAMLSMAVKHLFPSK
jgi:hypothetical protein